MHITSLKYYFLLSFILLITVQQDICAQERADSSKKRTKKLPDSLFIKRYDTLLHLQSWISANQLEYRFVYTEDFKLLLSPNEINNLSFGFSYRFLELGLSFSPGFLNSDKDDWKKGTSDKFSFGFGFSMHRFHLSFDLSSVKGFYLKNSGDFGRSIPDTPYLVFPNLKVGYFSTMLRYNINPRFSTAALVGGTAVQTRSAWTVAPTFQFATFRFSDDGSTSGVQPETTYSTDLNLLVPVIGSLVLSPKFSISFGIGPSIGVDFFKSVSLDADNKVVLSKGTQFSSGYTVQSAITYNAKRFYSGLESRYRTYGHKFEGLQRLDKEYSYFQIYVGWRLKAPGFAKRSLDWVNKISPIKFD
jgi:hypothetical protein